MMQLLSIKMEKEHLKIVEQQCTKGQAALSVQLVSTHMYFFGWRTRDRQKSEAV